MTGAGSTTVNAAQASPAPDFSCSTFRTRYKYLCGSKHKGIIISPVPTTPTPQQVVTMITVSRGFLQEDILRVTVCVIVGCLTSLPPQYMTILKTCSCCIDVFHPAARHGKPGLEACHKFYSTVATHHFVAIWNSHVSHPLSQPQ
jgi:hypothetical protein